MTGSFESLGLSPASLASLAKTGFVAPTPIQQEAVPPVLAGRDLIGGARTGSGKTVAYVAPVLDRLAKGELHRVLVLGPTRELVAQIGEWVAELAGDRELRQRVVHGGVRPGLQRQAIVDGFEVIVATPGRLIDLMGQIGDGALDGFDGLVLDEADRMLDMGFSEQLEQILAALPAERQTLLFSATIDARVAAFAKDALRDPVRVDVDPSGTVPEAAEQELFVVEGKDKTSLLLHLLGRVKERTLIFTRTKQQANRLFSTLRRTGYRAVCLHADRTPGQRKRALEAFRSGKYPVLVATDLAARGLDVEGVDHVINFELPDTATEYVHRIGRTARAQRSGRATTLVRPEEWERLLAIEVSLGRLLTRRKRPEDLEGYRRRIVRGHRSARARELRAEAASAEPPRGGKLKRRWKTKQKRRKRNSGGRGGP